MRNDPKVVIIIVNWNGKNLLKNCLISLKKNTEYSNYKVIVVDNGSTDGSVEFLKRKFPWVDVLALDRNYGFAGGNNRGIVYALNKYNPDYILLLNNDILIIQKDWLRKMVEVAESDKKIGIVGCKLIYPDGSIQHIGAYIDKCGDGVQIQINNYDDIITYPDYITGACLLIKRTVIDKVGLLDEGYFPAYYEDADYCYRVKKAGYIIVCLLSTAVVHYEGSTSKQIKKEISLTMKKNKIRFVLLNLPLFKILHILIREYLRSIFQRNCINIKFKKNWTTELKIYIKACLINFKEIKEITDKRFNRTKKLWWDYEES